jgi:hypothetical protein
LTDIAITGIGILDSIGSNLTSNFGKICNGYSSISPISNYDVNTYPIIPIKHGHELSKDFDLDDVLLDTMKSFLEFYKINHRQEIRFEDITDYHLWEVGIGRNREELIEYVREFHFSESGKIPPIPGAVEGLRELINGKFPQEVQFVVITGIIELNILLMTN